MGEGERGGVIEGSIGLRGVEVTRGDGGFTGDVVLEGVAI